MVCIEHVVVHKSVQLVHEIRVLLVFHGMTLAFEVHENIQGTEKHLEFTETVLARVVSAISHSNLLYNESTVRFFALQHQVIASLHVHEFLCLSPCIFEKAREHTHTQICKHVSVFADEDDRGWS